MKYLPIHVLIPSLTRLSTTVERLLGERDAVLAVIALEMHRQKNGDYPESLNDLVPSFLPNAPIDRVTGGALVYRIVEGKPLIYSIGVDRDDDGGRVPRLRGMLQPYVAAEFEDSSPVDGDWVLFPPIDPEE